MGSYKLSEDFTPSHFEGSISVKALERLREQRRIDNRAWFLTVSFHSPHPPMVPAWKHLRKYWDNRSKLFTPPSINDDLSNSAYNSMAEKVPGYGEVDKVREWSALYYALIEEVDEYVGKLLDALGEDASNTLVVFTSDHGEMLGAHGKREKNNFYEESSRVPLLLSFPGVIKENTVVEESVSHLDIFSTILDFIGANELDNSDGKSLRPFVDRKDDQVNRDYDQTAAFSEWDFRKPLLTNMSALERTIDERPSFMVRKGPYKLMMQKLADSNEMDMMFDLNQDPFEVNNLLGKYSMDADEKVIAKAEHLRCLLLDWMIRLDNGQYFSDPANNYGEGQGDINEVRNRQKWRQIGLWSSGSMNDPLEFGHVSWTGSRFVRHEWLYLGTRLEESYVITSASIIGKDSVFFSVDEASLVNRRFGRHACESIRVTFQANIWAEAPSLDASLILEILKDGETSARSFRVPLILTDVNFKTRRTTAIRSVDALGGKHSSAAGRRVARNAASMFGVVMLLQALVGIL